MGKYWAFFMISFKDTQVYKLDVLLKIGSSFVWVLALREVWLAIYRSGGTALAGTGVSVHEMAAYAMISVVMGALLAPAVGWEIGRRVNEGNIILDLQKPWNFQWMYLSKGLAHSVFGLIYIVLPLSIAIFLFLPIDFPQGWQAGAFIISLFFAFLLTFAVNFFVGLMAFYLTEVWGLEFLKGTVVDICSGALIPLWLFPQTMERFLMWLPFQGIYNIPLSLYIGKISGAGIGEALAFQCIWSVILLTTCQLVLKLAQRLLLTSGG
jgi:ABC-2 type transport system permease protein